jgi:hypothetical protein
MKDADLIDSYLNPSKRVPEGDYTKHKAALRRLVNRNLIKNHGPKFEENPNKGIFWEKNIASVPELTDHDDSTNQ